MGVSKPFERSQSVQPKSGLSREDIQKIMSSTRRIMDAALLPCSKRIVLSIDKDCNEEAATRRLDVEKGVKKSRCKRISSMAMTASFGEEMAGRPPQHRAQHFDGREIRRLSKHLCPDNSDERTIHSSLELASNSSLTQHMGGAVIRKSYPGATADAAGEAGRGERGFLLDLKFDVLSPQSKKAVNPSHFEPVTARARGTYVFGLKGDVVKSHSLLNILPAEEDAHESLSAYTIEENAASEHMRAGMCSHVHSLCLRVSCPPSLSLVSSPAPSVHIRVPTPFVCVIRFSPFQCVVTIHRLPEILGLVRNKVLQKQPFKHRALLQKKDLAV